MDACIYLTIYSATVQCGKHTVIVACFPMMLIDNNTKFHRKIAPCLQGTFCSKVSRPCDLSVVSAALRT